MGETAGERSALEGLELQPLEAIGSVARVAAREAIKTIKVGRFPWVHHPSTAVHAHQLPQSANLQPAPLHRLVLSSPWLSTS